jgi:tetratricopeptide (TPR) repeat protein
VPEIGFAINRLQPSMRSMTRPPSPAIAAGTPGSAADWSVLAAAAILILSALGAYWNSFNVPFLLDDQWTITNNQSIRHLERMGDVLSPPSAGTTAARPLLNLSFALNYAGGGMSVRGYHAINWLIHVCAGLALLGIVRRTLLLPGLRPALTPHPSDMGGTPMPRGTGVPPVGLGCGTNAPQRPRYGEVALPLAAFAALLWTLHPLQTEAVTYISQRAESLMGLFYLLTLYCFIRAVPSVADVGRDRRIPPPRTAGFGDPALQQSAFGGSNLWLGLSVAACLCGMATKQVMVTAPVLVLLYDRAFVSGSFRAALANRRWYYVSLATTWVLLDFLMHHSPPAMTGVGFKAGISWTTYALTELRVVTGYLKLAFWPHPLVFDYGTEILTTDPWAVAPYALIIVAILVGIAIAWRRSPMTGFLGCWFFLILAPTSTVVPIAEQPMAESRMYLPLAAVVVLVTMGGYVLLSGKMLASREEFLATKRHKRSKVSAVTCVAPIGARESLAGVNTRFLRIFAANRIGHFQSLNSTVNWYYTVLGLVAVGLGALTIQRNHDYRSELSIWEDTLIGHRNTSRGHNNLGLALAKLPGRLPEAIAHYQEALRINPANAEAHNNLAYELTKTPGRLPEAMAHYEKALRLKPGFAEAHNNLAIVLAAMPGRLAEAMAHYETALRSNPDYAEAHYNFAIVLAKIPGRLTEAIAHYEAALRLKPDLAEAHYNLGMALMRMPGRLAEAIAHYEEALRLRPAYAEAHNNLGIALAQSSGRLAEAIAHCEEAVRLKPAFAEAHNNLAVAYAATGRLAAAISQAEIAARLDPASATFRDNLEKLKARNRPDFGRPIP